MSIQVSTAFVNAFRDNIQLGLQQMGSRLQRTVMTESQNAEYEFYDRVTATEAAEVTNRHGDTPHMDTPHDRRRVHCTPYDWADFIDRQDKARMLADPTSAYVMNAVAAFGRTKDRTIITQGLGTAYTGKEGDTAVTLPSASKVAVTYDDEGGSDSTNLTIAKLRRARFLLDSEEAVADGEEQFIIVSASQIQSLLRTTEVTSNDYNSVKALVAGEINTFMGFEFVRTQLLPVAASIRRCMAYPRSAITMATCDEVEIDVGPRRDKRNTTQVYVSLDVGAVRMWEEKVIEISCDETA
jgi:hypothetical protein